jgi:hypothetical protein
MRSRASTTAEIRTRDSNWVDRKAGPIAFTGYVEAHSWPSRHLEVTTRAGHRSMMGGHLPDPHSRSCGWKG